MYELRLRWLIHKSKLKDCKARDLSYLLGAVKYHFAFCDIILSTFVQMH